ncbi:hypothetical protein Sinac_5573 [Singulisphaera acidiphila DSM 18658]|uniref:Uncharacterized protein n=1 Tax=Singulisphaera acidiphila (strain ATCC BAA-1392 / DSM 18658 / VKM B-2454 / MOB10) TaxID=886293 RepID=L0DLL0_SINAD|nr:hypothetical protein Sinac_5573 [Singulisphaera acidiphila DSM 18658]
MNDWLDVKIDDQNEGNSIGMRLLALPGPGRLVRIEQGWTSPGVVGVSP